METEFMNFIRNALLNFDVIGSIFVMPEWPLLLV